MPATKVKESTSQKHKRLVAGVALRRKILIAAMGGCCEQCGAVDSLEFHHTEPRTWTARELSRWSRQRVYEEEWEAGKIVLLCADCNKRAGAPSEFDDVQF